MIFRISLAVAVSGILILATTPLSYPVVSGINDKLSHIFAFFVLSLLADFSFPDKKFNLYIILPLMAYGLMIEGIQYFLPYRMFSLFDVAADAMGLVLYRISFPLLKKGVDAIFNKK
ncbi:MAG: VanZ family protein [Desulfobacteraceae bacterium]|nr:VanZ family protein [Desulfobacteraceae bacterium]MBC2757224.1 VanZ family protein [Desulfobacteraceae bacterium]